MPVMTKADVKSSTRTCEGRTKSGIRCRRRAQPGTLFCAQHAEQETPGVPDDIDRSELDEAIADLDDSRDEGFDDPDAPGGARRRPRAYGAPDPSRQPSAGAIDEVRQIVDFIGENVGKVRDVAVSSGVVDERFGEHFLADLANAMTSLAAGLAERLSGDYEEDDFGFDERFTERVLPMVALLYRYWWRCDVEGVEHVPAQGRGLVVSNHAGAGIPFDGAMLKTAIMLEHPQPRHLRAMVLDWAMGLPYGGDFMRRTGQVLACSPNALELLKRDELVAVFPEGVKGMSKPFSQRYNLQRFGRGGFVRIALRTGTPIIPVAVVGSEEIYPKVANMPLIGKLIGAPFVPVTPTFPLLGLAGAIPLPSKWHIEFCEPIDVTGYPPEAADDRAFVLELSERVRATIQERLRANLLKRRTPFW